MNSRRNFFPVMVFGCSVFGCQAPSGSEGATQAGGVEKSTPAARENELSMVGYDIRRLRPTDEPLVKGFERMRAATVKEGKRVAVLFSADWCEPCRDLEIELGNLHPRGTIEDVRIIELKEEEWQKAVRMDEFNGLRTQWDRVLNRYPLFVVLDDQGVRVEEMQGGRERLEAAGIAATVPNWFASLRALDWQRPAG
jgi:thiol-disulfide isomerase/thioredoxin